MVEIRVAEHDDRRGWEALWLENCEHFAAKNMTRMVIDGLWERILDPEYPMRAWLAVRNGTYVGLAHTILHPHTFSLNTLCYLEDLWVTPSERNGGIATMMIGHLSQVGRAENWQRLYWETSINNKNAQRFYDRLAQRRGTVIYEMDLSAGDPPADKDRRGHMAKGRPTP